MAGAVVLLLYFGRDTTFSPNELTWVIQSPEISLRDALTPYNGHLILTSRVLYKGVLATVGSDYLTFRLLVTATVLLASGLIYIYARRRIGAWAALAPSLVLLVFGADIVHVLAGNGITVLGALCCGLGALLALDREDRAGDIAACILLCLGVATFTVALAFVVGACVLILAGEDRWRRIWVALVPLCLYAAWWLWALQFPSSSEGLLTWSNLLLAPAWAFQSLAAALGALTGLDYSLTRASGGGIHAAGTALALAAVVGLAWRMRRSIPAGLLVAIATGLALAAIEVTARGALTPSTPRLLYPAAFVAIMIGVEAARGFHWSRRGLVVLFLVAAVGVTINIALLRENSALQRLFAAGLRQDLAGLELAASAAPGFDPGTVLGGQSQLAIPFAEASLLRSSPARSYLQAVQSYGRIGFSPGQLSRFDTASRARVDAVFTSALGFALGLVAPKDVGRCRRVSSQDGAVTTLPLPAVGAALESDTGVDVLVGRFADTPTVPAGSLAPRVPAALVPPPDSAPGRWRVSAAVPFLRVCRLR